MALPAAVHHHHRHLPSSPAANLDLKPNTPQPSSSLAGDPKKERRRFVRTREGCFTCRSRKKKCSLDRPTCSSCYRLGLQCVFPPQQIVDGVLRTVRQPNKRRRPILDDDPDQPSSSAARRRKRTDSVSSAFSPSDDDSDASASPAPSQREPTAVDASNTTDNHLSSPLMAPPPSSLDHGSTFFFSSRHAAPTATPPPPPLPHPLPSMDPALAQPDRLDRTLAQAQAHHFVPSDMADAAAPFDTVSFSVHHSLAAFPDPGGRPDAAPVAAAPPFMVHPSVHAFDDNSDAWNALSHDHRDSAGVPQTIHAGRSVAPTTTTTWMSSSSSSSSAAAPSVSPTPLVPVSPAGHQTALSNNMVYGPFSPVDHHHNPLSSLPAQLAVTIGATGGSTEGSTQAHVDAVEAFMMLSAGNALHPSSAQLAALPAPLAEPAAASVHRSALDHPGASSLSHALSLHPSIPRPISHLGLGGGSVPHAVSLDAAVGAQLSSYAPLLQDYYRRRLAKIVSVCSDDRSNGLLSVLVPMAQQSRVLTQAILAWSAVHLAANEGERNHTIGWDPLAGGLGLPMLGADAAKRLLTDTLALDGRAARAGVSGDGNVSGDGGGGGGVGGEDGASTVAPVCDRPWATVAKLLLHKTRMSLNATLKDDVERGRETTLGALVVVSEIEICRGSTADWIKPLRIASKVIKHLGGVKALSRSDFRSLFLNWVYHSIMSSSAPLDDPGIGQEECEALLEMGGEMDTYMGYCTPLFAIIAQISAVARQSAQLASIVDPDERIAQLRRIVSQAAVLEARLDAASPRIGSSFPSSASSSASSSSASSVEEHDRPSSSSSRFVVIDDTGGSKNGTCANVEETDGSDPRAYHFAAFRCFRLAARLYLRQVVLRERSSSVASQLLASELVRSAIPSVTGTPAESALLFPLFVAGVDACSVGERAELRARLENLHRTCGIDNIRTAWRLLEAVWEANEEGERFVDWPVLARRRGWVVSFA